MFCTQFSFVGQKTVFANFELIFDSTDVSRNFKPESNFWAISMPENFDLAAILSPIDKWSSFSRIRFLRHFTSNQVYQNSWTSNSHFWLGRHISNISCMHHFWKKFIPKNVQKPLSEKFFWTARYFVDIDILGIRLIFNRLARLDFLQLDINEFGPNNAFPRTP